MNNSIPTWRRGGRCECNLPWSFGEVEWGRGAGNGGSGELCLQCSYLAADVLFALFLILQLLRLGLHFCSGGSRR